MLLTMIVLDLGPMYATDRQTDVRQKDVRRAHHRYNAPCLTSVCLSVAYIGPKLRTERPRKTKIGTEVLGGSPRHT